MNLTSFFLIIFLFVLPLSYGNSDSLYVMKFDIFLDGVIQNETTVNSIRFYDKSNKIIVEDIRYRDGIILNKDQFCEIMRTNDHEILLINFTLGLSPLYFEFLINKDIIEQSIVKKNRVVLNVYSFNNKENEDIKQEWESTLRDRGILRCCIRKINYCYTYENVSRVFIIPHIPHYLRNNICDDILSGLCFVSSPSSEFQNICYP